MEKLYNIPQDPIRYIESTPDKYYPLRVLRAYRKNCDVQWAIGTGPEDPLMTMRNACDARAKILDEAITILEREIG